MKNVSIKIPDESYRETQDKLERLIAASRSNMGRLPSIDDKKPLRDALELSFMRTFTLHKTSILGDRNHSLMRDITEYLGGSSIFDHMTAYGCFGTSIIVTQPYPPITDDTVKLLEHIRIDVVDLNAWRFYYPSAAYCYALVVSRGSRRILKVFKDNDFGIGAKRIFMAE